jgi:SAM-dependent methyltransferase
MTQAEHWQFIAKRWSNVGSPLRPIQEDQKNFSDLLNLRTSGPVRALILGVTPELKNLPWPENSVVKAIDRSIDMIHAIWPGEKTNAVKGNWLQMPFADESFDCVLCDGGLHLLEYPDGHQALVESIYRVLSSCGFFALRLFALPSEREKLADVFSSVERGEIDSFHEFKLRVLMALQTSPQVGVSVRNAYDTIQSWAGGDFKDLSNRTGWPLEQIQTLESYRDTVSNYHFLSEEESISALTCGGRFRLLERRKGSYRLSQHCAILLLERT